MRFSTGNAVKPNTSAGCGISESTTAHAVEVTGPVRVTHPFHPLCGQELECVGRLSLATILSAW